MSNIKISQLSGASTLTGTEQIPLVQNGQTVKASSQDIANLSSKPYKSFVSEIFWADYQQSIVHVSNIFGYTGILLKNKLYFVVYTNGDDFSNLIEIVNDKPFGYGCIFRVTGDSRYNPSYLKHYKPNLWIDTELTMLNNVENNILYNDFGYNLEWSLNFDVQSFGSLSPTLSFPEDVDDNKLQLIFSINDGPGNYGNGNANFEVYGKSKQIDLNDIYSFTNIDYNWARKNTFDGLDGNIVYDLAVQTDGKILIGGEFSSYYDKFGTSQLVQGIMRLNEDCSPDYSFMAESGGTTPVGFQNNEYCYTIKVLSDGKILIGGNFTVINDGTNTYHTSGIARLNSDGTVDTSFFVNEYEGFTNYSGVYGIDVTSDGKILVVGLAMFEYTYSGVSYPINNFVVLNDDGSPNQTFLDNSSGFTDTSLGFTELWRARPTQNDKILVCGFFDTYNDVNGVHNVAGLIRLNSDYTLDETYYTSGFTWDNNTGGVYDFKEQNDGKILVGGQFVGFTDTGTTYSNVKYLIRLNSNGTFDDSFYYDDGNLQGFNLNPSNHVRSIDISEDGKILVGGVFDSFNVYDINSGDQILNYYYFIILNEDGFPYNLQNSGVNNEVFKVKNLGNKKCLVGGSFDSDGAFQNPIFNNGTSLSKINFENNLWGISNFEVFQYYPSKGLTLEVRLYE